MHIGGEGGGGDASGGGCCCCCRPHMSLLAAPYRCAQSRKLTTSRLLTHVPRGGPDELPRCHTRAAHMRIELPRPHSSHGHENRVRGHEDRWMVAKTDPVVAKTDSVVAKTEVWLRRQAILF